MSASGCEFLRTAPDALIEQLVLNDHRRLECLEVLLIVHVNHLVHGLNLQDYDYLLHLLDR